MIEVILLEKIDRLGAMGTVVKVRPGYARNYLLPQKKALRATKANLELFEKQRAGLEARNASLRDQAQAQAAKLEGMKFTVVRQAGETGQLYGSVSARDVSEAAEEAGQRIERSTVMIESPIKALGLYPVKVRLHPEVTVTVTINVARSPEEAAVQAEKGVALTRAAADAAEAEAEAEKASVEAIGKKPAAKKARGKAPKEGKEAEAVDQPAAETASKEAAEKKTRKPRAKKTEA